MGLLRAGVMGPGRAGSVFAASIGVMKLNVELAALRVMGLNPNHVLIAPRVVALVISLPLLAVLGMMAGMVAISCCCNKVDEISALVIGGVGGVSAFVVSRWIKKRELDDPVDAIAVHAGCGAGGMLAFGLLYAPFLNGQTINFEMGGLFT